MNPFSTLRESETGGGPRRRPASRAAALLALIVLVVAACGPASGGPAPVASIEPTAAPAATQAAAVPPTQAPATAGPLPGPSAAPTAAPTSLPVTGAQPTAIAAPTAGAGEAEVDLESFSFQPKVLTVKVGTRVKFSNKDNVQHTVTSDTGLFDSGFLAKGDDFFFTFTQAGTYPYHCTPHGGPNGAGMAGTIVVTP